jgi:hypothetical protein
MLAIIDSQRLELATYSRRGIFWQDLYTGVTTGSDRLFGQHMFPDSHWGRSTFQVSQGQIPPGFEAMNYLPGPVLRLLQDIHVLQYTIEHTEMPQNAQSCSEVDDLQACIEARLHDCLQSDASQRDVLLRSILLAAHLYTHCLSTRFWRRYWIPLSISTKLLYHLQASMTSESWNSHQDLLLWCVVVGGALTPRNNLKREYSAILRSIAYRLSTSFFQSWRTFEQVLNSFLWSKHQFGREAFCLTVRYFVVR